MSILQTAKKIMLEPSRFFTSIHNEKGYKKHLHYMVVITLVTFIFMTLYYLDGFNRAAQFIGDLIPGIHYPRIEPTPKVYLISYIIFAVLFFMVSNLRYFMTHLAVRMLGAKNPFYQTYKAMVYSLTPEYYSAPLLALILILPFFADTIVWIIWGVVFVLYILLSLYIVYIRTLALSELQKISMIRSFLAIYILGIFVQMMAVLTISVLLSIFMLLILGMISNLNI